MKTIAWEDFPESCLDLIDEVALTGDSVEITRDGIAVLRLMPAEEDDKGLIADNER